MRDGKEVVNCLYYENVSLRILVFFQRCIFSSSDTCIFTIVSFYIIIIFIKYTTIQKFGVGKETLDWIMLQKNQILFLIIRLLSSH